MLLMRGNRREDNDRHDYGRHMYDDREKDYDPYDAPHDAFRDRRGRRHYDNGKYAPMRSAYDDMMSYMIMIAVIRTICRKTAVILWDLPREMEQIIMNHIPCLCAANMKGKDIFDAVETDIKLAAACIKKMKTTIKSLTAKPLKNGYLK